MFTRRHETLYDSIRFQEGQLRGQNVLPLGHNNPKSAFVAIRNYLAGQFVGATNDDDLLNELLKILFCKLYTEVGKATGDLLSGGVMSARIMKSTFNAIKADFPDLFDKHDEILLSPRDASYVLNACQFPMVNEDADPIGDAFEVFSGSEARGKAGQFFTPRGVTDMLVDMVAPTLKERVIDPACGAGGFLASVVRHHVKNHLDRHSLPAAASNLWGVDKDAYLTRLAKLHVALLSAGEPNIRTGDSLALSDAKDAPLTDIQEGSFDVVLTNPPFGVKIISASQETLKRFQFARRWVQTGRTERWEPTNEIRDQVPPQVLFIERCLSLLRTGGRLGIVVPESLLSGRGYRFVNQYLLEHTDVKAVIGMPEELFKTSGKGGTHTKTCLLVAEKRKRGPQKTSIFMAEAEWCGFDSRAKPIPYNDIPQIRAHFASWKKTKKFTESHLGFSLSPQKLHEFILCPHYYDRETENELSALTDEYEVVSFNGLLEDGTLELTSGDELGKLSYGTGNIPFIRTSDLSNWEVKIDAKHNVDDATYKRFRTKQDVQPYDILMVRDGTYLIGTCAIVMPGEEKILYQSHIYKIRVNPNKHGVTPFLLLAILSSPLVQKQIRAKRFTQDIIDSLGDRIRELVLPIPYDRGVRDEISSIVEESISMRLKARHLAREARSLIGAPGLSAVRLRQQKG
jgi:type I restriction enzyme M protein